jgi:hypothetical protein
MVKLFMVFVIFALGCSDYIQLREFKETCKDNPDFYIKEPIDAVVKIHIHLEGNRVANCSAVHIGEGFYVTARHCFDTYEGKMTINKEEIVNFNLHETRDLAIFYSSFVLDHKLEMSNEPTEDLLVSGIKTTTITSYLGDKVAKQVKELGSDNLAMCNPSVLGDSGGAVVNEEGYLIGVVKGIWEWADKGHFENGVATYLDIPWINEFKEETLK